MTRLPIEFARIVLKQAKVKERLCLCKFATVR